ncbi:hypothetical protein [Raineyella sp. LH-20]|uniref:hypothetical protein n=1 Tax=Raineyella sp. LH-20 TaxID=3081204 RepID=UPI002953A6F7|nr:hypothetical protein [Raineyella sp. LH-20]WOP19111.1 hypothetical protein R0146_02215 [Raineyella sp. LH-20]
MPDVRVRFNPDRSRWEALLDGAEIGFLDYQVNCGIVEMPRAVVGPAGTGQPTDGVLTTLIRAGLDQARDDGLTVHATSPEVEEVLAAYGDIAEDLQGGQAGDDCEDDADEDEGGEGDDGGRDNGDDDGGRDNGEGIDLL